MFALILNQMCEGVKRGLSHVDSPRETPLWLMSADARLTMLPNADEWLGDDWRRLGRLSGRSGAAVRVLFACLDGTNHAAEPHLVPNTSRPPEGAAHSPSRKMQMPDLPLGLPQFGEF
jgi:hypothetical protein